MPSAQSSKKLTKADIQAIGRNLPAPSSVLEGVYGSPPEDDLVLNNEFNKLGDLDQGDGGGQTPHIHPDSTQRVSNVSKVTCATMDLKLAQEILPVLGSTVDSPLVRLLGPGGSQNGS